jgi:FMN phosphatase YigB (HAD superfamily)
MSKLIAVLFDFDGVLCTDRFYTTLEPEYPDVISWINRHVFGGENYFVRWMRGEYTHRQINAIIAEKTGLEFNKLNELFIESVRQMKINPVVIEFAKKLQHKNIKTALVTGNMDIFNEITVPEKQLDKVFPVIVNSYDFNLLKVDENGKLFDIALHQLGLASCEGVILVDDSLTHGQIFKEKGGEFFYYTGQEAFEKWAKEFFTEKEV